MTPKQFYDWQTSGGTNDVLRLVACLEQADILWCIIGGIAVNHWAEQTMVTQDVDIVIAASGVDRAVSLLEAAGFQVERFEWSINVKGHSAVSIQISTEAFYSTFPERSVPSDVHGILMRVASLEDTLAGKMRAWANPEKRQSKRIKDLADIARLIEAHPMGLPQRRTQGTRAETVLKRGRLQLRSENSVGYPYTVLYSFRYHSTRIAP